MAKLDVYLRKVAEINGSDLHLTAKVPPKARVHGHLKAMTDKPIDPEQLREMLYEILDERRSKIYTKRHDLDMAYEIEGVARFRVNMSITRRGPAAVFRLIPAEITPLEKLNVPMHILDFTELRSGLVLVTGPTGSGKSTTLAALLDHVNRNKRKHIITIEEPIEFVHQNRRSHFSQREIGEDAESFAGALRAATREDPDIVLVGELRDPETIGLAITAAEMGCLVFATLHTNSASKTVDRIIDVFPESQQNQIRTMLAETLKGVCAQLLLPREPQGRTPVMEILTGSFALRSVIREGSVAKIDGLIESGRGAGMQLMDDAIWERLQQKQISGETAYLFASNKPRFEKFMRTA